MVVALLAVTIGSIAVISTRVAHREIRKIEVKVTGNVASRSEMHRIEPPTRSLDRWFVVTFAGATIFGIAMAIVIARRITKPIERLTAAARRMEGGDLAVRVDPAGGREVVELAHAFHAIAPAPHPNEDLRLRS